MTEKASMLTCECGAHTFNVSARVTQMHTQQYDHVTLQCSACRRRFALMAPVGQLEPNTLDNFQRAMARSEAKLAQFHHPSFLQDLRGALNRHGIDHRLNISDHRLGEFLVRCLAAHESAKPEVRPPAEMGGE